MSRNDDQSGQREARRLELGRRSKSQLASMVRVGLIYSAHPPEKWNKDELISTILDREFRAAPTPAATVPSPEPAPIDGAEPRNETAAARTTQCARPGCTELIQHAATGRPPRYHSAACRQAAHRDRTRRSEAAGLRAAQLADARDSAAILWPQIEPTADDVAELAGRIVSYAAHEDPEDRGALALALGELRAAVDRLESLALTFRAADDRIAALS